MISFIVLLSLAAAPFPENGLASYKGDRGLEHDPRVVFVENFELPLEEMWKRWEAVTDKTRSISHERRAARQQREKCSRYGASQRLRFASLPPTKKQRRWLG